MYTHAHARTHKRIHANTSAYTRYTHAHKRIHAHTRTYTHMRAYTHTRTRIHTHAHVREHTQIMDKHAHTHTRGCLYTRSHLTSGQTKTYRYGHTSSRGQTGPQAYKHTKTKRPEKERSAHKQDTQACRYTQTQTGTYKHTYILHENTHTYINTRHQSQQQNTAKPRHPARKTLSSTEGETLLNNTKS